MKKVIPPDPENMNDDRAEWAAASLRHFQCTTGTDYDDALCDLLCDLMHWCDRHEFEFESALSRARNHYAAETCSDDVQHILTAATDCSPAPWIYDYSPYTSQDGAEIPAFEIHCPDHKVAETNEDRPSAEQEANARLISAAPELFAALEYFFNIMHDYECSVRKGYVAFALEQARSVLKRAKEGAI